MQQQEFDILLKYFENLKYELNKSNAWSDQSIFLHFKNILNSIQEIQKICNHIFILNQSNQNTLIQQQSQSIQQQQQYLSQSNQINNQTYLNSNKTTQQQNQIPTMNYQFNFSNQIIKEIKQYQQQFKFTIIENIILQNNSNDSEQCPICISACYDPKIQVQTEPVIQLQCQHLFHFNCLKPLIKNQFLKCPVCTTIQGKIIGDQPNGKMTTTIISASCEGFYCDTIQIIYDMESGKRNGIPYDGTFRKAFLPNNKEGQEICKLLQRAFNQRLIFTVGKSLTTGKSNQTIWNGIHHKTRLSGGPTNYGYPDFDYFDRVKLELKQNGIQ